MEPKAAIRLAVLAALVLLSAVAEAEERAQEYNENCFGACIGGCPFAPGFWLCRNRCVAQCLRNSPFVCMHLCMSESCHGPGWWWGDRQSCFAECSSRCLKNGAPHRRHHHHHHDDHRHPPPSPPSPPLPPSPLPPPPPPLVAAPSPCQT